MSGEVSASEETPTADPTKPAGAVVTKSLSVQELEQQLLSLPSKKRRELWKKTGRESGSPGQVVTGQHGQQFTAMMQEQQVMVSWHSPLPPASELARYNDVSPGLAERLMVMVEKQSAHRIQMESTAIPEQLRQSRHGQIFAFVLGMTAIGAAVYLAMNGQAVVAGVVGGGGVLALAAAFLRGPSGKKNNSKPAPQPSQSRAPGKSQ